MNIAFPWTHVALATAPCVGSFIGLLTLRLPAGRAWIVARSACGACQRPLGITDLAPIISFLALKGRCRTCGAPIPRRYIAIETGCLAIAAWAALSQTGPAVLTTALFGWALLTVAIVDAEHLWLPDVLTLPLGLAGWAFTVARGVAAPWEPLLGAAAGYLALAVVAFVYEKLRGRQGMGDGDPRLLGAIGAWVGWLGLPSVLLWACGAGLSLAAARALIHRRLDLTQPLPFGTFLAIGAWMTWLLGPLPTGTA